MFFKSKVEHLKGICLHEDLFNIANNMLKEDLTVSNKSLPNPLPEPKPKSFKKYIDNLTLATRSKYKYFSDSECSSNYFKDIIRGNTTYLDYFIEYKGIVPVIAEMSPQEYINRASKAFKKSPKEVEEQRRKVDNGYSVEDIKKLMQEGKDFVIPYLDYTNGYIGQEGLHRAIAAKDLGADKIPVLVMYSTEYDPMNWVKKENNLKESIRLIEANLYQLASKTYNETPKLAARADKVTPSYLGISKFGIYNFRTTSQTHDGNYWYQTIECPSLMNLDEILDEPDGHITARDIEIMLRRDNVKILCDDPSFLYWALKYMAWNDNYGLEPETRHPRVNNVHLQGALCKHLLAVVKMIQSGSVLEQMAKDTEQYLRFQRGETSRLHNNPRAMAQAKNKEKQIDYKTYDSYLNDYFASLAGKNSFLDDNDIKGSLQAEINKVNQTDPSMTLDEFITDEFGVDGVSGLANDLQISEDYINKYFKDLGF